MLFPLRIVLDLKLKWCILVESDNESTPTFSPIKSQRAVKVKTLEEIKLEKIQAESAAYYSYQGKYFFYYFLQNYTNNDLNAI